MNNKLATAMVMAGLLFGQSAIAGSGYGLGLEYEAEKEKASGAWSDTGYIIPSFAVNSVLVDKVELLLGYTQNRAANSGSSSAVGVRLRKNFELTHNVEGFVRAAVGHSYMSANGAADYNWGYIEPGLEMKLSHVWGLAISDRIQNSIDGTRGMSTNAVRVGPNLEIDDDNEVEFRYISTTGDYESESYMAEYVMKF
jgi:hypothetical protein